VIKADILQVLSDNGWSALQEKRVDIEGKWEHRALAGAKKEGDVIKRKWFHYYIDTSTNEAFWQETNPFPVVAALSTLRDEVNAYLKDKIADGTIEGGRIEQIDANAEIATAIVYIDDTGIKEKRFLVDKDNTGALRHRLII